MDRKDKLQLVQRYVERQRAYVPAYTKEDLWSERHGTPSKPIRSNEFGFDTPVLRPRVPMNKTSQSQPRQRAERSKSRTHEAESALAPEQGPPPKTQDPPSDKDKRRPKRKKASTPIDTDDERVARLADRRERKRKKRAIVNPPQKRGRDSAPTTGPKKGRMNGQKAKKPAALALLYGFSATNVTKDRLTVKPAVPFLGVFSKGKASAKKKVTATKKSSSKKEIFCESAFLNKPSERATDHSKVDDDSDDSSIASVSNDPTSRAACTTSRSKCTEAIALETPKAAARAATESEVWDIELESKLPFSARDVASNAGATNSAPVVLDLRKAEWSANLNVIEERKARCNNGCIRTLSVARSSPLAGSDPHDEPGILLAVGAPSIHPSHSASQVGCRARPSDPCQVTSKYFGKPETLSVPQLATRSPRTSKSNDNLGVSDFRISDQDVQDPAMGAQRVLRVASPIRSSVNAAQPMAELRARSNSAPLEISSDDFRIPTQDTTMTLLRATSLDAARPVVEFQTWSDVAPLEFPSDDCYACVDVPLDDGYFESFVMESQGAEYRHPLQCVGWDSYRSRWRSSASLAGDDERDFMSSFEGYDPLALEYEGDPEEPVSVAELAGCDSREAQVCEPWSRTGETRDFAVCEDEGGSSCWDGEPGEGVAEFLEGRALLLGVPGWPRHVGVSGLAQAEMDVASRLRDHWRPLRRS